MDDSTTARAEVLTYEDSSTGCAVAYFAIAPLFLLCALGYWAGGGDSGQVKLAVIGLTIAAVLTAVRGRRIHKRTRVPAHAGGRP